MNNTELIEMTQAEASHIEGGSFAYDAGRLFRFIGVSMGESVTVAIGDWIGLSVMNGSI
jgi:hypothetical protein